MSPRFYAPPASSHTPKFYTLISVVESRSDRAGNRPHFLFHLGKESISIHQHHVLNFLALSRILKKIRNSSGRADCEYQNKACSADDIGEKMADLYTSLSAADWLRMSNAPEFTRGWQSSAFCTRPFFCWCLLHNNHFRDFHARTSPTFCVIRANAGRPRDRYVSSHLHQGLPAKPQLRKLTYTTDLGKFPGFLPQPVIPSQPTFQAK